MSGFRVSESRLCLLKKISERSKRHRVRLRRLAARACDGTRTCDLLITNELHYQLCYTSIIKFLDFVRCCTAVALFSVRDLRITNALHYQLCYTSILCFIFATCAFWSEISRTVSLAPYFFPSHTHFICRRQRSYAQHNTSLIIHQKAQIVKENFCPLLMILIHQIHDVHEIEYPYYPRNCPPACEYAYKQIRSHCSQCNKKLFHTIISPS